MDSEIRRLCHLIKRKELIPHYKDFHEEIKDGFSRTEIAMLFDELKESNSKNLNGTDTLEYLVEKSFSITKKEEAKIKGVSLKLLSNALKELEEELEKISVKESKDEDKQSKIAIEANLRRAIQRSIGLGATFKEPKLNGDFREEIGRAHV